MSLRSVAVRVLALVWALGALVLPGFGLIDLSVSWDADWPVMLEAGWGLFFTAFVGLAFLVIAARPRAAAAPFVQLWLSSGCLVLAGALSAEPPALFAAALVALAVVSVGGAAPSRWRGRWGLRPLRPLVLLAVVAAAPAAVYAWQMTGRNREAGGLDLTMGVDHYAVQAAVGLAIVASTAVAACWPGGRRLLCFSAGASAGYLGLVSYNWPATPGGVGSAWSLSALVWGALVLVVAALPQRDGPKTAVPSAQ